MHCRDVLSGRPRRRGGRALRVEALEPRTVMTATTNLVGNALQIVGGPGPDRIDVSGRGRDLVVRDAGAEVARIPSASIASITIDAGAGDDRVTVAGTVFQGATIDGGPGNDALTGGSGGDLLLGGPGDDTLQGGPGRNFLSGGTGTNQLDPFPGLNFDIDNGLFLDNLVTPSRQTNAAGVSLQLTPEEVRTLLDRASAATPSRDAIIAIVDRSGRILGVRVEDGVAPEIRNDINNLVFAIDGAVAKARTGAFFANNTAPLTSRTVQALSESTTLQREVEANPSVTDPNSTLRGPGKVAGIGIKGHFPRRVMFAPQVDLFQIEYTNRDTTVHPGPDRIKGTADDVDLRTFGPIGHGRFNVDRRNIPERIRAAGQELNPPDSYGFVSGRLPGASPRGIGTLPGGLPILRVSSRPDGKRLTDLVGGLGVFFPGTTGFATEENSSFNDIAFNRSRPDRSQEAEAIAIAALGGIVNLGGGESLLVRELDGIPRLESIALPLGRIDLVGITLDIYGGHGLQGAKNLTVSFERVGVGQGTVNGTNEPVLPGPDALPGTADDVRLRGGTFVPEGFLVTPHNAADGSLTADDVIRITAQSVVQANKTRAAIRLGLDESARMIIAVTDRTGELLGLYRMPDATYFSLDVATAKARNAAYYADAAKLQPVDQIPGVPRGTAFTARTFRFAALPHFPEGQDNYPPGPFSILNDGQNLPNTALNAGPPLPASAFQSVQGFDAFNPQTNFRDPTNILNQNGIVFFPGSAPLYKDVNGDGIRELVGGFGISGDGIDQDDVVTFFGQQGFEVPFTVPRADFIKVRDVRLPYQKFNRQPLNRTNELPQTFPSLGRIRPIP